MLQHAPKLLILLAILAFLGGDGAAQEGAPESLFGDVIDVRVVNLEVVVTRKGERVSGLTPDDFELTVDGRPVAIEYFTEVYGGAAVEHGDEAGTLPALAPGSPVSTSYLVFIDEFFMLPSMRNQVVRGLIEQLPLLDPEDRMAIVAFDGKKIDMLSSWSQSVPDLKRVLEAALERPAHGLQRLNEERAFNSTLQLRNQRLNSLPGGNDPYRLDIEEEVEANRIADQVKRVVLGATSALRGFANPPGRKVMLLYAGGWPYNAAQWVVGDLSRAVFNNDVPGGDEIFRPLMDTANRLSYTLYPIDAPFIRFTGGDSEYRELGEGTSDLNRFIDREQEARTALNILADETGGEAIFGGTRAGAFERVVSDTRTYYWIGFTPNWQGDDSAHDIQLKARDKSLKVRSRESFSDLSRQTEVTMMVESSLILGDAPADAPLYIQLGTPEKAGRKKSQVPLTVIIPVDQLTFLPWEGQFVAQVELRVAVQDERGSLNEIPVIPMQIALPEQPKEGGLRRYDTALLMRNRKHTVVISLYDTTSGKILTAKQEFDPSPK